MTDDGRTDDDGVANDGDDTRTSSDESRPRRAVRTDGGEARNGDRTNGDGSRTGAGTDDDGGRTGVETNDDTAPVDETNGDGSNGWPASGGDGPDEGAASDDDGSNGGRRLDRRRLLAGLAVAGGLAGGAVLATRPGPRNRSPPSASSPTESPTEPPTESDTSTTIPSNRGARIDEFGAVAGRDDPATAVANTAALRAAARAAGRDGTVVIPDGVYYFGRADESWAVRFGRDVPAGVSVVGNGPDRSQLRMTSHLRADENYRGMRYDETSADGTPIDHGTVTLANLAYLGNYRNQTLAAGKSVRGLEAYGTGRIRLHNVRLGSWWGPGARLIGPAARVTRCTFRENGIGVARAAETPTASHHLVATPGPKRTVEITDCAFHRTSGSVVNRPFGDGDVTVRRCWMEGVGISLVKMTETAGRTLVEDSYFRGETPWLRRRIPADQNLAGRFLAHRISGEPTPTLTLNRVVARDVPLEAVLCFRDTDLVLRGDEIQLTNVGYGTPDPAAAIRGDSGISFDVGRLAVFRSEHKLFQAPGSTGRIEELYHAPGARVGALGNASVGRTTIRPFVRLIAQPIRRNDVGAATAGERTAGNHRTRPGTDRLSDE